MLQISIVIIDLSTALLIYIILNKYYVSCFNTYRFWCCNLHTERSI